MAADTTDKLDNNHASGVDQSADSLQPYGATLVDDRPYYFFKDGNGNLQACWEVPESDGWQLFTWSNLKVPNASVSIEKPMGAITLDGGRYYVFVLGSDGNLWCCWWTGSSVTWSNLNRPQRKQGNETEPKATPGSISIEKSMGAITMYGSRYFVFMLCSDGHLWSCSWTGTDYVWTDEKKPKGVSPDVTIMQSMGAPVLFEDYYYNFILDSDGNVQVNTSVGNYNRNSVWKNYYAPSTPIATPLGVATLGDYGPVLLVLDEDNYLWVGSDLLGGFWVKYLWDIDPIDTSKGVAAVEDEETLTNVNAAFYSMSTDSTVQCFLVIWEFGKDNPFKQGMYMAVPNRLAPLPVTAIAGALNIQSSFYGNQVAALDTTGEVYTASIPQIGPAHNVGWLGCGSPLAKS